MTASAARFRHCRSIARHALLGWAAGAALFAASAVAAPGAPRLQEAGAAAGAPPGDAIVEARDALRRKDAARLATLRASVVAARHPLAVWVDYWELHNRLPTAQQAELDAFYLRWPGSYLEDRLRNDWLLELGRRRDFDNFRREYPRFKLDDDREVKCWALLARHLQGEDVRTEGRDAWFAQRDADDGCAALAAALFQAKQLSADDVWRRTRVAIDANRPKLARQAAALLGEEAGVAELIDNAPRFLARKAQAEPRRAAELTTLALVRIANNEPDAAALALRERWSEALPADLSAWAWAIAGKQAALKLGDGAPDYFLRAALPRKSTAELTLPDDVLAWKLRAALRADRGAGRWQQVMQAVNAMSAGEQKEPAWIYWKARALKALAVDSQDGAALTQQSRDLLGSIAGPLSYYGKLAAEDLGIAVAVPPRPTPPTPEERAATAARPGFQRALALMALGLRSEGVREWNFTLFGLDERELLAAAQLACEREIWDRCINTSERTKDLIDVAQRFPMPLREDVSAKAREAGIDPAYVYGLMRQESRFIVDARSSAGASGLMQLMPATARWTARKLGVDYTGERINDPATNLRLGTGYLKLMLDSFEGSQALAAAGYNAGPGRPRRWREGAVQDAAVWVENIPISETRDYVKKVLSNAAVYAVLMKEAEVPVALRTRLGRTIGPREAPMTPTEKELP
ncbi:MAG TPA: transglycosylase SLT domain-containing protein [Methylibium sp.]|uniref:lytic transglycosylase domain-containing protein n=1 Tax=Methylibium sp. TaxID=2067992 RepID=UPI002DB78B05|nr:transglycosylase SLT domain-containing protein [Methylibium sp.]HEU4457878.1 transglycosylase SLT domain-containing protein [Methylibium sp.]